MERMFVFIVGLLLAIAGFLIDFIIVNRLDSQKANRKLLKTAGGILFLGSIVFSCLAWIPSLDNFEVFGFILIAVFLGLLNAGLLAGAAVSVVHTKSQSVRTWSVVFASLLSSAGFALIVYSRLEPYFA